MFAGAASFTDEADINDVNKEAVDTLVALGVIEGYLDGTFRPDDTVTRAEMAKMIYIIRTGRSDASAYNDDATTFTDIGDHWARGYIKYCNSMGIIAGHSATRFAPDATVTTQEAAKMLLVTLGYNAERAGLVGAGWGNKTNALADENGLLKDVNCGTTQGMPRQYAAQLINNAVFAPTVVLRDGEYTNLKLVTGITGDSDDDYNETIGEKYMGLKVETGVMTATGHTSKGYNMVVGGVSFTEMDEDASAYMGQKVKVLYKDNDEVFGIYAHADTTVMASGIVADLDVKTAGDKKVEFDGTEYDTAADDDTINVYAMNGDTVGKLTAPGADVTRASSMSLIDNNGDDKIDLAVVNPMDVYKVNYVGTSSMTLNPARGGGSLAVDLDELTGAEDIVKGDYVSLVQKTYTADDTGVMAKVDLVSGEVDGVNAGDKEVRLDGTWYDATYTGTGDFKLGNTVTVAVVNGVIYAIDETMGVAATDYLVLTSDARDDYGDVKAKALLADGTEPVITIAKAYKVTTGTTDWDYKDVTTGDLASYKAGNLYAYKVVDGEYHLIDVAKAHKGADDASNYDVDATLGYDDMKDGDNVYASQKLNGDPIDANALVFLRDKDGYKVVTGDHINGWKNQDVDADAMTLVSESNGYNYVKVAYVDLGSTGEDPGATSDAMYGYVVTAPVSASLNGETVKEFSMFDGTETVTVKDKTNSSFAKGDIIKYTEESDGVIKVENVVFAVAGGTKYGADAKQIVAINGDGAVDTTLRLDGVADEYVITEDTVILYINAKDVEGVAGGAVVVADKDSSGNLIAGHNNALLKAKNTVNEDGHKEIEVLVVDVNNNFDET